MARITWRDRSNSGANSAISASIFNDIKSSVNSLYTELEDVLNLSGSENARGGSNNYITPIAIYDPNDSDRFIDFSDGKFDFRGGDIDIRENLFVRGQITASKIIKGDNGAVLDKGLSIPDGFIKIGTGSTHITNNMIKVAKITSNDPTGEAAPFTPFGGNNVWIDSSNITEGGTQILLLNTEQDNILPGDVPHNEVQIYFDNTNKIATQFRTDASIFRTPLYILDDSGDGDTDGNIIPGPETGNADDRVLIYDTSDGQIKYRLANTFFSELSGDGTPFRTASIVGVGQNILSDTTTNLQFEFRSGLQGLIEDGDGPIIIQTSSEFSAGEPNQFAFSTASVANLGVGDPNYLYASSETSSFQFVYQNGLSSSYDPGNSRFYIGTGSNFSASYALLTEVALNANTASFVTASNVHGPHGINSILSASHALSSDMTWDNVLSNNPNADRDAFFKGTRTLHFGTELGGSANASIFYTDVDAGNGNLRLATNNGDNIELNAAGLTKIDSIVEITGVISASSVPTSTTENTVVLWNGHKLVSNEFSTLLGNNTSNSFATASFGIAGQLIADTTTSSFEFEFGSGLSGSINNSKLRIETGSNFTASQAISSSYAISASHATTASYILASNIDQPFGDLEATGIFSLPDIPNVSASIAAAVAGGDDLGNHTALENLNLANFSIVSASNVSASGHISASEFIGNLTGTADTASFITASNVYGPHGASSVISSSHAVSSLSASYALTASYIVNAETASFITASNVYGPYGSNSVISASFATHSFTSITASYATFTTLANTAYTASYVTSSYVHGPHGADSILSASHAVTASYVSIAQTASFVSSSNIVGTIDISDQTNLAAGTNLTLTDDTIALDANISLTSVTASLLGTSSYADQATSSSYASTASYVENAISASYVDNAFTSATITDDTITLTQFDGDTTDLTINNTTNATSASYAETASYFDIEFGSTVQGTLTASINGVDEYIDLGVQTSDNVTFANFTATGNTVKLTGIPTSPSVLTPLVIDSDGCIYTGSAYTAYTPSGDIDGFYAGADSGTDTAIGAAGTLNIIGDLDTPGIITSIQGTGGNATLKIGLSNILSSSAQIASDITGAFSSTSSSIASEINSLQNSASAGIRFAELGNSTDGFTLLPFETGTFDAGGGDGLVLEITGQNILYKLVGVLSSSAQIATDISGAINSATSSVLSDYNLLSSSAQIATDISGAINSATSSILNDYNLLSGSAQIATDISGAIDAATGSLSSSLAIDINALELSASAGINFQGNNDTGFSVSLTETASFQAAGDVYPSAFSVSSDDGNITYTLNLNNLNLISQSYIDANVNNWNNQNAFSTASIEGTNLQLTSNSVTGSLIFEAGNGIHITTSSNGAIYITASAEADGDNLGNHIASQSLNMDSNNISNIGDMTVDGDIKLTALNKIIFNNDSNTYIKANNDVPEDLELGADGDIILNPDNNVGISIIGTSPSEKLHVGGKVRATHFLATGGSGDAPSFSFSGETDTGLYRAVPGTIALQVNGDAAELSLSETQMTANVATAIFNTNNIKTTAIISSSAHLISNVNSRETHPGAVSNQVVLYDTSSGRFFYTGSYGGGGGSSNTLAPQEILSQDDVTSNTVTLGTIPISSTSSYVRAEFYAREGNVIQAARSVFVFSASFSTITATTTEDVRTHDTINLFNINTVSGSWDTNGNLVVKLRQYNNLSTDYRFRYIIM